MILRHRSEILLLALALLGAVFLVATGGLAPILFPDSPAYLTFSPGVTATYPLFIAAVGVKLLPAVQIALYAAGAAVLGITLQRLFGRWWLSAGFVVALFINPEMDGFLHSVLSEGLFLPVDLFFLAALLVCAVLGSWRAALIAAVLAGLAVTIRPISYPLIVTVVAAVLFRPGGWSRRGLLIALGCLIAWTGTVSAERAWSRRYHGAELTSLTGPHLFAKGALLEAGTINTTGLDLLERQLAEQADHEYAPVRAMLVKQRDTVAYPALLAFYEVCIQHGCSNAMRQKAGISGATFNRSMARVGLRRVRADLPGYLRLASDEYQSLWSLNSRTHPGRAAAFDATIASARPLPLENQVAPELFEPTHASRIAYLVRPIFILLGILIPLVLLITGGMVVARRPASPFALPAFLLSAGVIGISLFGSFAGIGEGRYTMGIWPNIAATILLAIALVAAPLFDRHFRPRRPTDV